MTSNESKHSECEKNKKEKDYVNNCKFSLTKNSVDHKLASNNQPVSDSNIKDLNNVNIFVKNGENKIDSNNKDSYYLNKKKKRLSKKIIFKRNLKEEEINEFTHILLKIINESAEKNNLIIFPKANKKMDKNCDLCNKSKMGKEDKILKFSSKNELFEFFQDLFSTLEQGKNKETLMKISSSKYNKIIEQKEYISQIKLMDKNDLLSKINKNFCYFCIKNYLIKSFGIKLIFENLQSEEEKSKVGKKKKFEIIDGFKNMLINSSKNNINENNLNEENNNKNILLNDINIFNDKKENIFDLILGDEDINENDINDFENNSEDNKSIRNKNFIDNKNKINEVKKEKKNKKAKIKENKITFKKEITTNKSNNNINENINNINNVNNAMNMNDKNKNINIINMNNFNNINQFNDPKYTKKNSDQVQSIFFNMNYIPNNNNSYIKPNIINNNIGYLNNEFTLNEDSVHQRLNSQISNLKNKINYISNLNKSQMNNNLNDLSITPPNNNNNFTEHLNLLKNSMYLLINYISNMSDMFDKYVSINENTLSLMNSLMNNSINPDNVCQLQNNNNYFFQILSCNINIQKMNIELCDLINKHFYH